MFRTENVIGVVADPFTQVDEVNIDAAIGIMMSNGETLEDLSRLTDTEWAGIIDTVLCGPSEKRQQKAIDHATRVAKDRDYLKDRKTLPKVTPLPVVTDTRPVRPGEHPSEELIAFINNSAEYKDKAIRWTARIEDGDEDIKHLIGWLLYESQMRDYVEPRATGDLEVMLNSVAKKLLKDYGLNFRTQFGSVISAVRTAVMHVFYGEYRKGGTSESSDINTPAHHWAMAERTVNKRIRDYSTRLLRANGTLGYASIPYQESGVDDE